MPEGGQVLRDGRLGDVEARREILHRNFSTSEALKDGAPARVREGAEDGVFSVHVDIYKLILI